MLRNKGLALLGQKRFAAKLDGHQTAGVLKQAPLAQPPQNRVGRGFFPLQFLLAELDQLAGRDGRVAQISSANRSSTAPSLISSMSHPPLVYSL